MDSLPRPDMKYCSVHMDDLKKLIREVPDFPKKGILFYDITTLLKDSGGLAAVLDALAGAVSDVKFDLVAGIESRGFMFAPALAQKFGKGFVPVRKPGRLPAARMSVEYALEYGEGQLDIHVDSLRPGQRVVIIDDLLATGGTAAAARKLVEQLGAVVAGLAFVVELLPLAGRDRLAGAEVIALTAYQE